MEDLGEWGPGPLVPKPLTTAWTRFPILGPPRTPGIAPSLPPGLLASGLCRRLLSDSTSPFLPLPSCLCQTGRSLPSSFTSLPRRWLQTDGQGGAAPADAWAQELWEGRNALLSDLETTTSHMPRSGALKERPPEPLTSPLTQMGPGESSGASGDKDHLYSTVCKPRSPKPAAPATPPFSSSCGVLGTGLCELDRLLQELNATQFNITDEIMSQFPSSKETAGEQKEDQSEDKKRPSPPPSPSPVLPKPSATSATLELDRLMASLSDFRVQNHLPASGPTPPPLPSSVNEDTPSPTGPTSKGSLDTMLGLLQSDLSRRGVVTALGRAWHPEHFVCGGCSTALGGSSFFEKDGAPFCPECYFERFSPRCGLCNQPIRHKMVTALGTHWHPEHFCCVSCGEPFGDEGESLTPILKGSFQERAGKPYCQPCFLKLFG
ncbi:TGFB1I1 [Cervus elaphus hippelaphus]|uniref:TGFB1I1 n=1 Tax=Cervus elaphus hippelaphus TaxID=46360 RepID=A0A212CZA5_CEREH|nr:TGFB1I1 [Cervus elaphus hippelaphus]